MASVIFAIMFGILLVPVENVIQSNCTGNHGIQLVEQPNNTKVCLNGTAYFSCSYTGTSLRPNWIINSSSYASNGLPPNTRYDATTDTLIVNNITADQNNQSYQCFFPFFEGSKPCDILSSIGRLQLYSVAPDACVCQEDEKNICSCFQNSVNVSISEELMSTSSEDFAVRVNCHSNFCEDEAVGLQLEIRNEFETDNKTNFTCATKAPVFTHNRKVCAVADNITLTFDISVHITSFESETLTKICLLDRQNYSMKLSECPSDTSKWPPLQLLLVLGLVVPTIIVCIIVILVMVSCCIWKRRRRHYKDIDINRASTDSTGIVVPACDSHVNVHQIKEIATNSTRT